MAPIRHSLPTWDTLSPIPHSITSLVRAALVNHLSHTWERPCCHKHAYRMLVELSLSVLFLQSNLSMAVFMQALQGPDVCVTAAADITQPTGLPERDRCRALTSQPEAGAAYSMESSRAVGMSSASQVEGQHWSCSTAGGGCGGSPGVRSRRHVTKGPPRMPCTNTTSMLGASAGTVTPCELTRCQNC